MLRALWRDPLYLRYTRLDAVAGLVELMTESQEVAPRLRVPMLVLLGARDQIVPPQASRRFVASLDPTNCSVVTYLNGWHLLLRDHQREKVFADILAWVEQRLAAVRPRPSLRAGAAVLSVDMWRTPRPSIARPTCARSARP